MLKKAKRLSLALATALICLALIMPSATAYVDGIGYIYLTTDGSDDLETTDYAFYVETPTAVGLDADYWNFTVYSDPISESATNATYYVHIYIYDGATNLSKNVTIAAKNDRRVYSNASHAAAAYSAMVENQSATTYIYLKADTGEEYEVVDSYSAGIMIYEQSYIAVLVTLLYALIPLIVLMVVLNYVKGAGKGFKRK